MVTLCCVSLNSRQLENRLACVACLHRADCRIAQGAKITLTASQAALKIGRTTRRTTVRGCLCSTLQVVLQKKKKEGKRTFTNKGLNPSAFHFTACLGRLRRLYPGIFQFRMNTTGHVYRRTGFTLNTVRQRKLPGLTDKGLTDRFW